MTTLENQLPSPAGRGAGGEGNQAKTLLDRAKFLRKNQTGAEQRLWYHLRAHRFLGLKFKRQKPIGHYIVDFVCFLPKLVIEIDGGQHAEQVVYDQRRNDFLRQEGFTVLRFWNNQVLNETEAVLEVIRQAVLTLSLGPSPEFGRGEKRQDFSAEFGSGEKTQGYSEEFGSAEINWGGNDHD